MAASSPTPPRSEEPTPHGRSVLVLGATGYVGGRLVPHLLSHGHRVRCLVRSDPIGVPWVERTEIVHGDVTDPTSLDPAFRGVDTVVYLVHSLDERDFEPTERQSAANVRRAAERAGVRHIVYLSGLGDDVDDLSPHLRSRHTVGRELAAGDIPVTELRAAVILGAGSASFEMLRSLTEVLPLMIAPRWVTTTLVQPIAIGDAIHYLHAAIDRRPTVHHRVVQIGGPERLTYRDLIDVYADVARLPRRVIVPVPFVSPRLSTHWVNLVSPLPRQLAGSLIDSLRNDVVVTDDSAAMLGDHLPLDARTAIGAALSAVQDLEIPTRWSGLTTEERAGRPRPWDPEWAGGTVYEYATSVVVDAPATIVMRTVQGIGGERGWYGFRFLWTVRGLLDKLVGGVGLRRGRRHPDEIAVGEALDFWRVDAVDTDMFRLRAEMKLPGEAWLEWITSPTGDGRTKVDQKARYVPRGVLGRLYWWPLWPVHAILFPTMLRRIGRAAEDAARDRHPTSEFTTSVVD